LHVKTQGFFLYETCVRLQKNPAIFIYRVSKIFFAE
jgi:hypothetical protein